MSLAAETRNAASDHPFLLTALRAGVINYTAAARFLAVDGDLEAIAAALRRYAEDLPDFEASPRDVRVTMQSGLTVVEEAVRDGEDAEPLLRVGEVSIADRMETGESTGILATGDVDAATFSVVLDTLAVEGISVVAAGFGDDRLIVVVDRLDGANAVRAVERAVANVPNGNTT